ncbi:MAG: thiaminase II/PqqC family protein [Streptosporangiaceae bacterium]
MAYTSYLLATAHGGSNAEGVGAVLPCYGIYWKVGTHLTGRGSPSPRYQRWIEAYAADDYGADVRAVLAEADRLGADLPAAERALVRRHVRVTGRYEWMFWDAAYHRQAWPEFGSGQPAPDR